MNAVYALNINIGDRFAERPILLVGETVGGGIQLPFPTDQWVLEMENAHNIALAMLQRAIIDFAQGPGSPAAQQFIAEPNNTETKALCSMIRARANGRFRYVPSIHFTMLQQLTPFSNVSTYGLALILTLGTLVIAINASLVYVVIRVRKWRKLDHWKTDMWFADELLQLQTAVFALEPGVWKNGQHDVPVTVTGCGGPVGRRDLGLGDGGVSCIAGLKGSCVEVAVVDVGSEESLEGNVTPPIKNAAIRPSAAPAERGDLDVQTSESDSIPEVSEVSKPGFVIEHAYEV